MARVRPSRTPYPAANAGVMPSGPVTRIRSPNGRSETPPQSGARASQVSPTGLVRPLCSGFYRARPLGSLRLVIHRLPPDARHDSLQVGLRTVALLLRPAFLAAGGTDLLHHLLDQGAKAGTRSTILGAKLRGWLR